MIPPLSNLNLTDPVKAVDISRISDGVKKSIDAIRASALLDGVLLPAVALAIGNNTINTNLGRLPAAVFISPPGLPSGITEVRASRTASTIVLNATVADTVDVWVC